MTRPADTTSLIASSTDISSSITSSMGNSNRNPEVGFGVVGTKTLTISLEYIILRWNTAIINSQTRFVKVYLQINAKKFFTIIAYKNLT